MAGKQNIGGVIGYKPRWRANLGCVSITILLAVALGVAFICAITASYSIAFNEYNTEEDQRALLDFQFQRMAEATARADQLTRTQFWERQTLAFARGAVERILITDDFELLRFACAHGILNSHLLENSHLLGESIPACERAAELNLEDAILRDYHGLVRLFDDDTETAIEDFKYYVDWLKTNDMDQDFIISREEWITELLEHERRLTCGWGFPYSNRLEFTNPYSNSLEFTNPEVTIELPCFFVDRRD